jgi:hypothetical protein
LSLDPGVLKLYGSNDNLFYSADVFPPGVHGIGLLGFKEIVLTPTISREKWAILSGVFRQFYLGIFHSRNSRNYIYGGEMNISRGDVYGSTYDLFTDK